MLKDFFVCLGGFFRIMTSTCLSFHMRGSVHTQARCIRGDFLRFRSSKQNTRSPLFCPKPSRSNNQNAGLDLQKHQDVEKVCVDKHVVYKVSQRKALIGIQDLAFKIVTISMDLYQLETSGHEKNRSVILLM